MACTAIYSSHDSDAIKYASMPGLRKCEIKPVAILRRKYISLCRYSYGNETYLDVLYGCLLLNVIILQLCQSSLLNEASNASILVGVLQFLSRQQFNLQTCCVFQLIWSEVPQLCKSLYVNEWALIILDYLNALMTQWVWGTAVLVLLYFHYSTLGQVTSFSDVMVLYVW